MQKDIMDWLKTQANIMPTTPQRMFYEKYQTVFPDHTLSYHQFGRFLASQNIKRVTLRRGDSTIKVYSAVHNPDFEYTPIPLRVPCDHCNGKGYQKIVC